MNARQIITLFKTSSGSGAEATPDCLTPEQLAAFHDGELFNPGRAAAEAHLAACDRCLSQLAVLSRASGRQDSETGVSAALITRAEALFRPPAEAKAPRQWRWAVPLAAAAALLLTLNLALDPSPLQDPKPDQASAPQTRYAKQKLAQPRLLAPAEGSVVQPLEQVFQWTEVPGTLYYDLRVVSLDGDLILRERVDGTRWLVPDSLRLEPGAEYFVRVDAYLTEAKYLSSEHRVFRVGGEQ